MNSLLSFICKAQRSISNRWYHYVYLPFLLSGAKSCGKKVIIGQGSRIAGIENMVFGDDVYIGPGAVLYSTRANLVIGSHISLGPNVTVVTGDHRTDVIGEYMKSISEDQKLPENDQDVVIEDDVWIGAGALILKGVHIGEGCVIAAGAIVSRDVIPYTIYISKGKEKKRFTNEQISEHKRMLNAKYSC